MVNASQASITKQGRQVQKITVPPREGVALELKRGQLLKVIDLEGGHVTDLLAYRSNDYQERLSAGATIDNKGSLYIGKGG